MSIDLDLEVLKTVCAALKVDQYEVQAILHKVHVGYPDSPGSSKLKNIDIDPKYYMVLLAIAAEDKAWYTENDDPGYVNSIYVSGHGRLMLYQMTTEDFGKGVMKHFSRKTKEQKAVQHNAKFIEMRPDGIVEHNINQGKTNIDIVKAVKCYPNQWSVDTKNKFARANFEYINDMMMCRCCFYGYSLAGLKADDLASLAFRIRALHVRLDEGCPFVRRLGIISKNVDMEMQRVRTPKEVMSHLLHNKGKFPDLNNIYERLEEVEETITGAEPDVEVITEVYEEQEEMDDKIPDFL